MQQLPVPAGSSGEFSQQLHVFCWEKSPSRILSCRHLLNHLRHPRRHPHSWLSFPYSHLILPRLSQRSTPRLVLPVHILHAPPVNVLHGLPIHSHLPGHVQCTQLPPSHVQHAWHLPISPRVFVHVYSTVECPPSHPRVFTPTPHRHRPSTTCQASGQLMGLATSQAARGSSPTPALPSGSLPPDLLRH